MNQEDFNFKDIQKLLKTLKDVEIKTSTKIFVAGMKSGAIVIAKTARKIANAKLNDPSTPNSIAKNIQAQFARRRSDRTGQIWMRVGVLGGAKDPDSGTRFGGRRKKVYAKGKGGDTFYWRFHEVGFTHKGGKRIQNPFIVPAAQIAASQIIPAIIKTAERKLAKIDFTSNPNLNSKMDDTP